MHADDIKPGQRWVSNSEPELGLGVVISAGSGRVSILFPAADERREYALGTTVRRVAFEHWWYDELRGYVNGRVYFKTWYFLARYRAVHQLEHYLSVAFFCVSRAAKAPKGRGRIWTASIHAVSAVSIIIILFHTNYFRSRYVMVCSFSR